MGSQQDAADQKIRIYDRAADQAFHAGNLAAFKELNDSLHDARMERLAIRDGE